MKILPRVTLTGQSVTVKGHSLSAEDGASIARASEELHRRGWSRIYSLNEIVNMWSRLVREIEQGYSMTIDDYTNDLSIRRWPEDARPLLTNEVVEWMDQRLGPLDERFAGATDEAVDQLPGVGTEHWWERRLPKVLIGELAEDVASLGLGADRA